MSTYIKSDWKKSTKKHWTVKKESLTSMGLENQLQASESKTREHSNEARQLNKVRTSGIRKNYS